MDNHKPWEGDELDNDAEERGVEEVVENQPEPKPVYEVVRGFSVGRGRASRKVRPGDEVPSEVSEKALEALLQKGVLRKTL